MNKIRSGFGTKTISQLYSRNASSRTEPHAAKRSGFDYLANLYNIGGRREYVKRELVGFTMEQMYEVVSDVSHYYLFVPYVRKSFVHSRVNNQFKADLIVGFPPLREVYTSTVIEKKPTLISSECNDGKLFNYLLNEWKFSPGVKDKPQTCVIDFKVAFEFKLVIHNNITRLFFDLICHQMENAFKKEAKRRFGNPSIMSQVLFALKT